MGRLGRRVKNECNPRDARGNLLEHLKPFTAHLGLERREPGNIAPRLCKARDKSALNWIEAQHEHDRYRPGRALQCRDYACAIRYYYLWITAHYFFSVDACAICVAADPVVVDMDVGSVFPACGVKPLPKGRNSLLPFQIVGDAH